MCQFSIKKIVYCLCMEKNPESISSKELQFLQLYFSSIIDNTPLDQFCEKYAQLFTPKTKFMKYTLFFTRLRYFSRLQFRTKTQIYIKSSTTLFIAYDPTSNEIVADKSLKAPIATNREIGFYSNVSYPFINRMISFDKIHDSFHLYTYFCPFGSLEQVLKIPEEKSPLFLSEKIRIFRQALITIEYLHSKKFYHRDLKPDNFFIDHNLDLLLSDFGSSKHKPEGENKNTIAGTPLYMSKNALRAHLNGTSIMEEPSLDIIPFVTTFVRTFASNLPFSYFQFKDVTTLETKILQAHLSPYKDLYFNNEISNYIFKIWNSDNDPNQTKHLTTDNLKKLIDMILQFCREKLCNLEKIKQWIYDSSDKNIFNQYYSEKDKQKEKRIDWTLYKKNILNTFCNENGIKDQKQIEHITKLALFDVLFYEAIREICYKGKENFEKSMENCLKEQIFIPDIQLSKNVTFNSFSAILHAKQIMKRVKQKSKQLLKNVSKTEKFVPSLIFYSIQNIIKCHHTFLQEPFLPPRPYYKSFEVQEPYTINKISYYAKILAKKLKYDSNDNFVDIEYNNHNGCFITGRYLINRNAVYAISYHISSKPSNDPNIFKVDLSEDPLFGPDKENVEDFKISYENTIDCIGLREVLAADISIRDGDKESILIRKWTPLRAVGLYIARTKNVSLLFDGVEFTQINVNPPSILQISVYFNNTYLIHKMTLDGDHIEAIQSGDKWIIKEHGFP